MKKKLKQKIIFDTPSFYSYIIIFFITYIVFKIILPLGDEADYFHRFQYYIFNFDDFIFYSHDFNQAITCNKNFLVGELLDLFLTIAPFFCTSSLETIFERSFIGFVINIIYFILIFTLFKNIKILKFLKINKDFNDVNMHIFFCSLLYPTIVYYLGARSNEVFLYYFAFLLFFTWRNYIISFLLGLICLSVDFGNGLVLLLFLSYFYFFRFINHRISLKFILLTLFSLYLCLILFHSELREFISPILFKTNIVFFQNLSSAVLDIDKNFQVPNFIKLIVTYFSFIFLTPGFLKSITLIILMTLLFIYIFFVIIELIKSKHYEEFKKNKLFKDYYLNFIICVTFIILSVLVLPTHSFIRYYLFVYPFIFSIIFAVLNLRNTFLISFYAILILSIEILSFRLLYYL